MGSDIFVQHAPAVEHGGEISKLAKGMNDSLRDLMHDLEHGSLVTWVGVAKDNCVLQLRDYEKALTELCVSIGGLGLQGVKYADEVSELDRQLASRFSVRA